MDLSTTRARGLVAKARGALAGWHPAGLAVAWPRRIAATTGCGGLICALTLLVAACGVPLGVASATSLTSRPATVVAIKPCGDAARYVSIGAHGVACRTARAIAHAYLHGNHHPYGFRCRHVSVNAAAGYYTHCTKRAAFVNIVPE